jgi:hypothetical protein
MKDKCKCGAGYLSAPENRWVCGTHIDEDGALIVSDACRQRMYRQVTGTLECLLEFHRGIETLYHRWSTGDIVAEDFVDETVKLLIVLPAEDQT